MQLRANAVEFIFDKNCSVRRPQWIALNIGAGDAGLYRAKSFPNRFCGRLRRREHALDRPEDR